MKNIIENCCSEQWQEFLNFHIKECQFEENEYIFKSNQTTLGLYIIQKGAVKITRNDHEGNQKVIRIASAGHIVGHRGFGGDWILPINAQCYKQTTLKFIPLKVLNTVMELNPKMTYHLMMFFAEELRDSEKIRDLISVKSKVAWVLIKNLEVFPKNKKSGTMTITIPRKDIASFANTTYETVVRSLSELNKEGLILIDKKNIVLKKIDLLNELIQKNL
jgi:CRP/FNR family transcriptional regulator